MDKKLLYGAAALLAIGMIMIYSASSVMAESRFGSHLYFLKRQMIWLILAGLVGWLIYRVNLKKLGSLSVALLFASLGLLALVFLFEARNGSHRWIFLGPLTIQPSELFKLAVIWFLAFSLSRKDRDITDYKQLLVPYVPLIGTGILLIILEPGLGSAIIITLTVVAMFFLAGMRLFHLGATVIPFVGLLSFVVFYLGYKKTRVLDYLAAVDDPLAGSYHVKQAVLALGAGGWIGAGVGNGNQKLFFLPYPHTDFIFAAIGEELGFIGLMVVLALYYYVIRRGLKIARGQPDRFGYLLGMGLTCSIAVSVIINIGVVTSLLPTTGIPLPMLSYGGSALVVSVATIAMLLNLSRRKGAVLS
jgi:cell division protein FtsW